MVRSSGEGPKMVRAGAFVSGGDPVRAGWVRLENGCLPVHHTDSAPARPHRRDGGACGTVGRGEL